MPEIGDIYRVVYKSRLVASVECRNMFGYVLTSANATETQVATGLETKVEGLFTALATQLDNLWVGYESETQKWYPAVGGTPGYWLGYHTHTVSTTGSFNAQLAGYQPAALLLFKTGFKRVMGRKFLAGVSAGNVVDGLLYSGFVTALGTFIVGMLDTVTFGAGGVATPGVLDKTGSFRPYLSGAVSNIVSSMRRRKPGYGM